MGHAEVVEGGQLDHRFDLAFKQYRENHHHARRGGNETGGNAQGLLVRFGDNQAASLQRTLKNNQARFARCGNLVADAIGKPLPEVGVTTFRPPYTPVTFGAFAGRDVDDLLEPVRRTPLHAWHERNGALFENVGQWRRAWYYPRPGEDMHAAVNREVKAVRDSLGILDATTLGKIDIQGADAAEFLNRVYTNAWLKLDVGRCRYGLMLKEDGMVMDDGVTTRLGERHFLMTTTTGNAAAVLGHLEDYLQTEWPDLEVHLTSVTEQFATMTLSGPNARRLLQELTDADLSPEALPHMAYTPGKVAGVPARVMKQRG